MKKFSILGLCLAAGLTMSAQADLVKEVERTVKSGNFDYTELKAKIDEMTQNEETKGNAKTWMVAGNAAFANYDALFLKVQMGQEVDKKEMGLALVDGYDFMLKALPLDTVIDEKGKVKTKESKKITKAIIENHQSLMTIGEILLQQGDNETTYKLLSLYVSLPNDARFEKIKENLNPEHIKYAYFYKAYVCLNSKRYDECLEDCAKANELGYNDKQLYDVALGAAFSCQNLKAAYDYAEKAYQLYGEEDSNYLKNIINIDVYNKEFDKAKTLLNGLIQKEPNNAEYYDLLGALLDSEGKQDEAIANYKKSIELNPSSAITRLNFGRLLYNKAYAIDNQSSALPPAQYDKIRAEQTEPLLREAAAQLEEAYKLDELNMGEAVKILKNIYYILGDEENLKRAEMM